MPSTLSIIRATFLDPRQRTRAIAIWSAGATGGGAMGPLIGGALLENFWWGAAFLINIPVMIIILALGIPLLAESRDPQRAPIDLLSALLSWVAIVPLVYAIKTTASSGISPTVIVTALVGLGAGVVFVLRQRGLTHPLIDVSLFKNPAFAGSVFTGTIAIFSLSGLVFFFSQYLQLVRGYSPLVAGLAELPSTLGTLAVIAFVGWFVTRLGRGPAIGTGLAVVAAGLVGLAAAEGLPNYLWLGIALAVIGAGIALTSTVSTDTIVTVVPRERAGAASSISETGYELGIALGIAVLGSLLNLFYAANLDLPADLPADARAAASNSLASATVALRESFPEALIHAQHAFPTGMQITALVAAGLIAVAAVIAFRLIPASKVPAADVDHR